MIRRSVLLIAALVPVAGLLPSASAAPPPPSEATVLLKDAPLSFDGKNVVLQLSKAGTATVTWKWDTTSTRPHNVEDAKGTFNSHPGCTGGGGFYGAPTGLAQCGYTGATTFKQTFRKAGTYSYFCRIHGSAGSGMAGTVVVKAAPAAAKRR